MTGTPNGRKEFLTIRPSTDAYLVSFLNLSFNKIPRLVDFFCLCLLMSVFKFYSYQAKGFSMETFHTPPNSNQPSSQETMTVPPISTEFIYAGFWRRLIAALIDGSILAIPALVFNIAIPYVGGAILALFFRPIFDASPIGATPGRAFMGLKMVNLNGGKVSYKQAYIRYFGSILSAMLCGFGYLISLFTEKRQTLHDMIAGTLVIEKEIPESTHFFKLWINEISKLFTRMDEDLIPNSSTSTSNPSPLTDLEKQLSSLKSLMDQGLITPDDYERKKTDLLSKI